MLGKCKLFVYAICFIPQTGLPVGFYLRKKEIGHAGGRAVLCWAQIWLCWACWAGLAVGFGSGGRAELAWARFGFLCMVYIVHVFFISSWCLCAKSFSECFSWIERCKKSQKAKLLWVFFDFIDLLALFGVYAGIIFIFCLWILCCVFGWSLFAVSFHEKNHVGRFDVEAWKDGKWNKL